MEGRLAFQKSHTIKLKGVTISILKMVMGGVLPPPPVPLSPQGKDGGGWGRGKDSCNAVGAVTDKTLSRPTSRLTI